MKLFKPKVKMKRNDIKTLENIVAHLYWYKSQYDGAYDSDYIYGNDNKDELRKIANELS